MSERTLRITSVALAAAGSAIAVYLLYVRQTGGALICSTGGCEAVQQSSYAEVLGVPVAAVGLAGYLALVAAAVARGEWARMAQATLALTALAFSAYLLVIQLAVIDAVCQWCVASDVLTTGLAALALLRLRLVAAAPAAPAPPHPRPRGKPAARPRASARRRRGGKSRSASRPRRR